MYQIPSWLKSTDLGDSHHRPRAAPRSALIFPTVTCSTPPRLLQVHLAHHRTSFLPLFIIRKPCSEKRFHLIAIALKLYTAFLTAIPLSLRLTLSSDSNRNSRILIAL